MFLFELSCVVLASERSVSKCPFAAIRRFGIIVGRHLKDKDPLKRVTRELCGRGISKSREIYSTEGLAGHKIPDNDTSDIERSRTREKVQPAHPGDITN